MAIALSSILLLGTLGTLLFVNMQHPQTDYSETSNAKHRNLQMQQLQQLPAQLACSMPLYKTIPLLEPVALPNPLQQPNSLFTNGLKTRSDDLRAKCENFRNTPRPHHFGQRLTGPRQFVTFISVNQQYRLEPKQAARLKEAKAIILQHNACKQQPIASLPKSQNADATHYSFEPSSLQISPAHRTQPGSDHDENDDVLPELEY